MLDDRERQIIRILWEQSQLSRWQLHLESGLSPNGVGTIVRRLLDKGILRECDADRSSGGRPQVPLELDPLRRHVVGVLISQRVVEVCRLNLCGNLIGKIAHRDIAQPRKLIVTAADLMSKHVNKQTLGISFAAAGLIDAEASAILMSSAIPDRRTISLQPIYDVAAGVPLVLANDMQALAARWMLAHRAQISNDVLLIGFVDGSMGAAMLIDGQPNRGCVMACNELGHTRLPVETDRCYCGQTGCLEMICSTGFLHRNGLPSHMTLQSLLNSSEQSPALDRMLELIAIGIANSINFVRPHRLVLVSNLVRHEKFIVPLMRHIRSMLLPELVDRVRTDLWDQPAFRSAETAGWAALANIYTDRWKATKIAPRSAAKLVSKRN